MSQPVVVNNQHLPAYLQQLARLPQPTEPSQSAAPQLPLNQQNSVVAAQQDDYNVRESERACIGGTQGEYNDAHNEARRLYDRQNALFRPEERVGWAKQSQMSAGDNLKRQAHIMALAAENKPFSEIECAIGKEMSVQAEVDRRIKEARAAGAEGNATLERARALRAGTGTLVPRKNGGSGPASGRLLGNNVVTMAGSRKASASYNVSSNESNAFLRRTTGVDFPGDKCQRLLRKQKAVLAPKPIAEPPAGYLPGGGSMLSDRERMDIAWDKPHLAGEFMTPHKKIDPRQWTKRPVGYGPPPKRFNLADEIPFAEPHNRGVFMEPEPVGSRVSSETVPYNNMPGDSFAANEMRQIRVARDQTVRDKLRQDVGPPVTRLLPFREQYDQDYIDRSERMSVYTLVDPKVEKRHLEQTTTDTLERGIQLIDEAAMYDPTTLGRTAVDAVEQEKRLANTQQKEQQMLESARQAAQSQRAIGQNTDALPTTEPNEQQKKRAIEREAKFDGRVAQNPTRLDASEYEDSFNAVRGLAQNASANSAAVQQRLQQRETDTLHRGRDAAKRATAFTDSDIFGQLGGADRALQSLDAADADRQNSAEKEGRMLLRARVAQQRANMFTDPDMFDSVNNRVENAMQATNVADERARDKEVRKLAQGQAQVADRQARVRLSATDSLVDPDFDFSNFARRGVDEMQSRAHSKQSERQAKRELDTLNSAKQLLKRARAFEDESRLDHLGDKSASRLAVDVAESEEQRQSKKLRAEQQMLANAHQQMRRARHFEDSSMLNDIGNQIARQTQSSLRDTSDAMNAKSMRNEQQMLSEARQQLQRASVIDDADHEALFAGVADRTVQNSGVSQTQMDDSSAAAHVRKTEAQMMAQSRQQFARARFDDLGGGEEATQRACDNMRHQISQRLRDQKARLKEMQMQSSVQNPNMLDSAMMDDSVIGQVQRSMQHNESGQERGKASESAMMQRARTLAAAQKPLDGMQMDQSLKSATHARQLDTNSWQAKEAQHNSRFTSRWTDIDQNFEATAAIENTLNTNLQAERASQRGRDREDKMLMEDRANRQALRVTDASAFEHHAVDDAIGSEPHGGQAAFDRRAVRRQEQCNAVGRQDLDDLPNLTQSEHILKQMEAVRCPKPSDGLHADRQQAHIEERIRLERGAPTHLLPAYMIPGGKKQVTPRGSPCASPVPFAR